MSLHNPGFVVPMPVLLELSTSTCVYVQGRCTEWSGYFSYKKKEKQKQKKTPQTRLFVHASSKLQSRSLRFCWFFFFPSKKQLSVGFRHL